MSNVPPQGGKDAYVRDKLQELASVLDEGLPQGWGFFLMVYPFGDAEGRFNYIGNGNRNDVVKVMANFIEKSKGTFGTHSDQKI